LPTQPLKGSSIRSGTILYIGLGKSLEKMMLSIYVNGFRLTSKPFRGQTHPKEAEEITRSWSPFCVIEKCTFKVGNHNALVRGINLTLFSHEAGEESHCFMITCESDTKERDRWLVAIVTSVCDVTKSCFPQCSEINCGPPVTCAKFERVMAGYLLLSDATNGLYIPYCELRFVSAREARFVIYRDERCDSEVDSFQFSEETSICNHAGFHCNMFEIGLLRFCTRLREEKEQWLRAMSGVKLRLADAGLEFAMLNHFALPGVGLETPGGFSQNEVPTAVEGDLGLDLEWGKSSPHVLDLTISTRTSDDTTDGPLFI